MEREFYDFAVDEFNSAWKRARNEDGQIVGNQFHYEKILPRN